MTHIPPRNLYRKVVAPAISPDSGRPLPGVNMVLTAVLTKVLTHAPKNRKQDRHREGYMREWMRKKRAANGDGDGELAETNKLPACARILSSGAIE